MSDLEGVYTTLYPPTRETIEVERGEGFLRLRVYDQEGEMVAWRILGRGDLLKIAKEGR